MNGLAGTQQVLGVGHTWYRRSCAKLCVPLNRSRRQQRVHLGTGELGTAACSRLTTLWASARDTHHVHVAVHQRAHGLGEVPHSSQSPTHLAAAPASTDDSLKIIMLLSLSLTLMLLPWMSRHPEFLIAPALLAVTPVVGNGVRPLLKEVIKSLFNTLRLSFGALTHHDEQLLPSHHAHDIHHQHVNSNHHQHNGRQQHMQQQHQQSHHQQPLPQGPYSHLPQQPTPIGPYSPWPNPAQVPARWQPVTARSASARSAAAGTRSTDVDGDWTPSSSPDPHHMDRHSQQHLQEVLAADQQTERELGQSPSASLSSRSPSGSPGSSLSSIDGPHHGEHAAGGGHRHQHNHHGRDPRMLSKEAKQQLYNGHHQQQQQQ